MMKTLKNIVPKGFDFTKEQWRDAFENNKPLVVVPFVSTKCNMDCIYCMMNDERTCYKGTPLTLTQHKKVLQEAYSLGARTMVITGMGESFMDPIFYNSKTGKLPLIEIAEEIGLYTIIFTNAQLITEKLAKSLYKKKGKLNY